METAKVDIRKLQLLNDRINQCIDALSQVRLSVHGLTNVAGPAVGAGGGFGQSPMGSIGLSHTGTYGSPYCNPFVSPGIGGAMNAGIPQSFGSSPFGQLSSFGQTPIGQNPWFQQAAPGLSHSTGGPWASGGR